MRQLFRKTQTGRTKIYHDADNKTESGQQAVNLKKVDMLELRNKGLSIEKISQMLNVPEAIIERQINFHESCRVFSGVY
ncbi:MAG: hypothetical protein R6X10_15315 [Desulfobacterales bacterium]